jgi:hypothetical protein
VTDEVVAGLVEGVGDDRGAGDPVQRVDVGLLDTRDEVVEPRCSGHPDRFRHIVNSKLTIRHRQL